MTQIERNKPKNRKLYTAPGKKRPKSTADRLLEQALEFKNQNDYVGALKLLVRITKEFPHYAPGFRLAAGLCWQSRQFDSAIIFGKKAVALSPKSELASMVLFQSFLNSGNREAAIEELTRFIQIGKSEHYQLFLKNLADEETDSKRRASLLRLADRAA